MAYNKNAHGTLPPFLNRVLTDLRTLFSDYGWLLLSHHPRCLTFSGRTLQLGKLELCRGCLLGYASAVATLLIIAIGPLKYAAITYFVAALIVGGLAALGLAIRLKPVIWLCDVCRGLAFALGIASVFASQTILQAFLFGVMLTAVAIGYLSLRFKLLHRKCQNCQHYVQMPYCPGLSPLNVKLGISDADQPFR